MSRTMDLFVIIADVGSDYVAAHEHTEVHS